MPQPDPRVKNAIIGRMMGAQPEIVWRIMNREKTAFCMEFRREEFTNPRREAEEWVAENRLSRPEYLEQSGYHAVACEEYPNYLGMTAAAAQFINWGMTKLSTDALCGFLASASTNANERLSVQEILFVLLDKPVQIVDEVQP